MKNFKVRCVNDKSNFFEKGGIYDVKEGILMDMNNEPYDEQIYSSVDEINKTCVPQFELVKEEFTKSNLKDGMVVTYRNGGKRIVIGHIIYEYREAEYCYFCSNNLNQYNNNLNYISYYKQDGLDIVKVEYMGEVLWEREEYFTLEEAFKPNRLVKHKDCSVWSSNPHSALHNACERTKRDMFELLKAKEFEFKEV